MHLNVSLNKIYLFLLNRWNYLTVAPSKNPNYYYVKENKYIIYTKIY